MNAFTIEEGALLYARCKTFQGITEKKCPLKALYGRGRKRGPGVKYLHKVLFVESERHSSTAR